MTEIRFLITEDGSHTIYLPDLNETYHSTHGAIQESQYVFIERGLDHVVKSGKQSVSIFEVGFGTGLNALLGWMYAENNQVSIRYQSIEAFPITHDVIAQLNYPEKMDDNSAAEKFLKIHQSKWEEWIALSNYFQLNKIKKRIEEFETDNVVDVCFFDAFAPSKQPEMWDISILKKIKEMLVKNGIIVTYCAKGQLKRDLKSLGFEVEALPGPPGKFEMVRAVRSSY